MGRSFKSGDDYSASKYKNERDARKAQIRRKRHNFNHKLDHSSKLDGLDIDKDLEEFEDYEDFEKFR